MEFTRRAFSIGLAALFPALFAAKAVWKEAAKFYRWETHLDARVRPGHMEARPIEFTQDELEFLPDPNPTWVRSRCVRTWDDPGADPIADIRAAMADIRGGPPGFYRLDPETGVLRRLEFDDFAQPVEITITAWSDETGGPVEPTLKIDWG